MNCLENLVGLEDCTTSTRPFLINDIGYDADQLGELMDSSFATVDDFFNANVRTAARLMQNDLFSMMPAQMKIMSVQEGKTIGHYPELRKSFTGTGISGIRQLLHNPSDYLKIRITRIRLFTEFTGNIDVSVYNLNEGNVVETVTIPTVAGALASFDTDIEIQSSQQDINLFIGYDTTGKDIYSASLTGSGCCGKRGINSGWCNFYTGTVVSPFIESSFESIDTSPGLSYDYEIVCDNLQWFCTHRTMFGMAMLYKTAMTILESNLFSGGQFSEQKTLNYENNKMRYDLAAGHYENQMKQALASMRFPRNRCFTCNSMTEVLNRLPG